MTGLLGLTDTEGFEIGTMRSVKVDEHEFLVARVGSECLVSDARCTEKPPAKPEAGARP